MIRIIRLEKSRFCGGNGLFSAEIEIMLWKIDQFYCIDASRHRFILSQLNMQDKLHSKGEKKCQSHESLLKLKGNNPKTRFSVLSSSSVTLSLQKIYTICFCKTFGWYEISIRAFHFTRSRAGPNMKPDRKWSLLFVLKNKSYKKKLDKTSSRDERESRLARLMFLLQFWEMTHLQTQSISNWFRKIVRFHIC